MEQLAIQNASNKSFNLDVFKKMSHHVSNEWIEVNGDKAVSESYVVAFVTKQDDDGDIWDKLTGGRYLDSFSNFENLLDSQFSNQASSA